MNRRSVLSAAIGGLAALPLASAVSQPARANGETGTFIDVPTYVQQRNLSCEYAALTIATAAFGGWVSEYEFDERVGAIKDMAQAFVIVASMPAILVFLWIVVSALP